MRTRKIAFEGRGAPCPLDSILEIMRAFPDGPAGGSSVYPGDRPPLLGERIRRVQDEAASIAEVNGSASCDSLPAHPRPFEDAPDDARVFP
jgi:hypothetical protein